MPRTKHMRMSMMMYCTNIFIDYSYSYVWIEWLAMYLYEGEIESNQKTTIYCTRIYKRKI